MSDLHDKTRDVYEKQHSRMANDKKAFNRFLNMVQEEYFELPKNYFRGKKIIDVGCGNYGKMIIRFHDFGCTDITGLELGEHFKEELVPILNKYKIPKGDYNLVSGSVLELPFPNETFDFVCCHGVLCHLGSVDEFFTGFDELSRVTKQGGHLYVVTGVFGGLIEFILPTIREYYRTNDEFKNFVDNLSPDNFDNIFNFIEDKIYIHEDEKIKIKKYVRELFDIDLCVTIQNVLQAPTRIILSPDIMLMLFQNHGFEKSKQLKRYVRRKNIRRFVAPLHYYHNETISRILYGTGNLEYIGEKIWH